MNSSDPLWDPLVEGDAQLRHIEALLSPYRLHKGGTTLWTMPTFKPAPRKRRLVRWIGVGIAACVLLAAAQVYRLSWHEGAPWRVRAEGAAQSLRSLVPGETVQTDATQMFAIDVARIGRIALSPSSRMALVETRTGSHRVRLEHGHLRARIWAPPGYFRVADARSEVVDLGCDFDLWKQADGSGRVYVRSGWVAYRIGAEDMLVPAGFSMRFDTLHASTPLRPLAVPAFAATVQALDERLLNDAASTLADGDSARAIAAMADDADAFTLLSLISRHRGLAGGPMYARLASALNTDGENPAHRAAWISGDAAAIDAWWSLLPSQPKRWWSHWLDAWG